MEEHDKNCDMCKALGYGTTDKTPEDDEKCHIRKYHRTFKYIVPNSNIEAIKCIDCGMSGLTGEIGEYNKVRTPRKVEELIRQVRGAKTK